MKNRFSISRYNFDSNLEKEIIDSGVKLLTNTSVESMEDVGNKIKINTDKGEVIVDVVVMSIGFRPNTSFTDINKAPNGAIIVNEMSETSETDIYAIGDCALIYNYVKDTMDYIPLATGANKQGRMIADFKIEFKNNHVHVLNAPSPAATASLAIGRHIVDEIKKQNILS